MIIRTLLKLAFAGVPTMIIGFLITRLAYAERGYEAVGGEWFLIVGVFAFLFWIINLIMER